MRYSIYSLTIIYLSISGCATLTEAEKFERDTQHSYDAENWMLCEMIFKYHNVPTTHFDHEHGERDIIRPWMIRSDLLVNRCRTVIKRDYWAD